MIFEIVQVTVDPFLIFPISVAVTSSVNCLIPREIRSLSISMSNILALIKLPLEYVFINSSPLPSQLKSDR